jgi:hypothetical protein
VYRVGEAIEFLSEVVPGIYSVPPPEIVVSGIAP